MKRGSLGNFCSASLRTATSSAFLAALFFFAPAFAHAQVLINEVMYDPSGSDDKQEWIELYNAGDAAVDISKYSFSDGSSATKHGLNAPPKNGGIGSLSIPAGGYLIIADDALSFEAANPSVANVIDSTMSLPDPNAGVSVTVTLYDDQKNVADTFMYVGGSNADNKGDSAQRAGSLIIPAAPTPALANAQEADTADLSAQSGSTASSTQTQLQAVPQAPVSSYVPPPLPALFADAGSDISVIVGADAEFKGRAYTRSQDLVDNVRYSWNFGDGSTAEGAVVLHRYAYPEKYAVVLTVSQDKNTAIDRVIVTAEPANLSFTVFADGSVSIENRAGRDIDLSRWFVKNISQQFMLPDDSIILAGGTMRIPHDTLGFWSSAQTELDYPNGVEALHAGEGSPPPPPAPALPVASPAPIVSFSPKSAPKEKKSTDVLEGSPQEESRSADAPPKVATTTQSASAADALPLGSPWLWAALGLCVLGAGAGYLSRKLRKNEWDIEDMGESV